MKQANAKVEMLEHSEAKVELYRSYLATYLNILSRVPSVRRVFIFDLFCGKGVYDNGLKGSPLVALDVIRNHYFGNNHTCPDISLWFNDNGSSQIESGVHKVDRVKKFAGQAFVPKNVNIKYDRDDYDKIFPAALKTFKESKDAKALFFLDQYGYKDIEPEHIRSILATGDAEALIFLPISFMYRFAAKSTQANFLGGEALYSLLTKLFGSQVPHFSSPYHFLFQMRERFKAYLAGLGAFVDAFAIQRDSANVYALMFFTTNVRGYEKMLATKWGMDSEVGQGYRLEKSHALFNVVEVEGYPRKLEDYIRSNNHRTNNELYLFGLENGFLPKHTNELLKLWKKERDDFEVVSLDGQPIRCQILYIISCTT